MAEASQVINATLRDYIKGSEDETIRKKWFLNQIRKRGRLMFNCSGTGINWALEAFEAAVSVLNDGDSVSYAPFERYRRPDLEYRGLVATESISRKRKLMNRSRAQLIDLAADIGPKLNKAMENKMGLELYVDGNATGNEGRMHGLESFMAVRTTPGAADRIAEPGDSYAGLNTNLADQGGTWSSDLGSSNYPNATLAKDWPDGQGDTQYDYFAPKLINYKSTGWNTGATTFAENAELAIGQALIWCNTVSGGSPDIVLLTGKMFNDYQAKMRARFRIQTGPAPNGDDMGFKQVTYQDGCLITYEYGVPADTGYGLNFDEMEFRTLQGSLFEVEPVRIDPQTFADLYAILWFGNMKFNPKAFFKLKNYA
jgi:hypothetical protein